MQNPSSCPHCRSPQAVQRVPAIVAGGTQHVRVITADFTPGTGVARINLAQLLAPPRQPGSVWLLIVLLFGLLFLSVPMSCMITMVITGLQGQDFEAALGSGAAERVFIVMVGVVALVSVALTAGVAHVHERSTQQARARWNTHMQQWQNSWYCHRCHVAFVAGSTVAVAPEQWAQMRS